jgi:cell division protein FtsB
MRRVEWKKGLAIGVLILTAVWLVSLIWGLAGKAQIAWREAHDTKAEYEQLEARQTQLAANIAALNTPRGQDAAIREAFGVARPGEEVIIVVPPASSTPTSTPSWWRQVLDWF